MAVHSSILVWRTPIHGTENCHTFISSFIVKLFNVPFTTNSSLRNGHYSPNVLIKDYLQN